MEKENKKLKTYQVDGLNSEVDAISIVEFPAIESDFVYLSKERQKETLSVNEEKRMLYGAVLIPDFPIYRNNGYEEFNIIFSATAIEQLSKRFMTESRNRNWTTDHSEMTDALSVVETWIKAGERDKSVMLGFDLPKGTWFVGVSVNDNTLWEQIKAGQYKGFSIESFLDLKELENNFNKQDKQEMDKDEKMNKFMEAFKSFLNEFLEKDEPEVAPEVTEEEKVEEELEEENNEEPQTEEVEIPEPAEDNEVVVKEAPESIEPEPEQEHENLSSVIAELEAKLKELEDENSSLQDKVENLSKQPSAEPVNVNAKKTDSREFLREIANKF